MPLTKQLSLFGVEAAGPEPADLAGLLAGPGQVVRMGGTARVSVVVDDPWRAAVLVAEFARRSLRSTCIATVEDHIGVRTAYSADLVPLAAGWQRGAVKVPPPDLLLDGRALRLWVEAAGRVEGATSYLLPLGPSDESSWAPVGTALAAAGLRAELVRVRGVRAELPRVDDPHLVQLRELVAVPDPADPTGDEPPSPATGPRRDRRGSAVTATTPRPASPTTPTGLMGPADAVGPIDPAGPVGPIDPAGPTGRATLVGAGLAGNAGASTDPAGTLQSSHATMVRRVVRGGPAYRITGRRRLARLAELIGDPPAGGPQEVWPGS